MKIGENVNVDGVGPQVMRSRSRSRRSRGVAVAVAVVGVDKVAGAIKLPSIEPVEESPKSIYIDVFEVDNAGVGFGE